MIDHLDLYKLFNGFYDFSYIYKNSMLFNNTAYIKFISLKCTNIKCNKKRCWNERLGCNSYFISYDIHPLYGIL